MTADRAVRSRRALGLLGAVAVSFALVVLPATGSAAATPPGSVPQVVAQYAADPAGLLARVKDLFGLGSSGGGIDFGDAPTVGTITRVFHWSDGFVAGITTGSTVKRVNEWTVPVLVNAEPVGVATIWINPGSDAPELAEFVVGSALGASFNSLPAGAFLVHDEAHSAWFLVEGAGVAPLVSGTSGVSVPLSLDAFRAILETTGSTDTSGDSTPDATSGYQGALNSALVLGLALLIIAAALYFPGHIRRLRRSSPVVADAPVEPVVADPVAPAAAEPLAKPVAPPKADVLAEAPADPPADPVAPAAGEPSAPSAPKPRKPRPPAAKARKPRQVDPAADSASDTAADPAVSEDDGADGSN